MDKGIIMTIGAYRINFDALLARLLYRWPIQSVVAILVLVALLGIRSGLVPPIWRGQATLVIQAAPDAIITVDDKPWTGAVYAGTHRIETTMPDGRMSWADLTLQSGQTLTMTLPVGLTPVVQPLPAAAPGMYVKQVYYADGAWRIQSTPAIDAQSEESTTETASLVQTRKSQTIAVRPSGAERLSTIDTYGGLADQMTMDNRLLEAVYQPMAFVGFGSSAKGSLSVRGWATSEATIPISNPVTLVRFSPDGRGLLIGEQIGIGEQLSYIAAQTRQPLPAVAIPGRTTRIDWQESGDAALITSVDGTRLTLTLLRVRPSLAAIVVAEQAVTVGGDALVPVTWDANNLYWIVQDETGSGVLWRSPLSSLLPERLRPLTAAGISILPDGSMRTATIVDETVVIGREQGNVFIGEAVVANLTATPDLVGRWQNDVLLMQGSAQSWLITLDQR